MDDIDILIARAEGRLEALREVAALARERLTSPKPNPVGIVDLSRCAAPDPEPAEDAPRPDAVVDEPVRARSERGPRSPYNRRTKEQVDEARMRVARLIFEGGPKRSGELFEAAGVESHSSLDGVIKKCEWFERIGGLWHLTTAGHQACRGNEDD